MKSQVGKWTHACDKVAYSSFHTKSISIVHEKCIKNDFFQFIFMSALWPGKYHEYNYLTVWIRLTVKKNHQDRAFQKF